MISVVIPTLNAADRLARCFHPLALAAIDEVVKEVIIVDGGSSDDTLAIAEAAGAKILPAQPGRGAQLRLGGEAATGTHLLFLHADTVLEDHWHHRIANVLQDDARFGVFTLRFDAEGFWPSVIANGAMWRTRLFSLPFGDQGLLVPRTLYDAVGGFREYPLFEDVDLIERLVAARGRKALRILPSTAHTSAKRYQRNGYLKQAMSNMTLLFRYKMGASPDKLAASYR